jgi:hypothetical protein
VIKDALLSDCGTYRYTLSRTWDESLPVVLWVLLNPSTADAELDDPTLRKGIGFAKRWGFGGVIFVNLFAFRATKPKNMRAADDPVGSMNDLHIFAAAGEAEKIVLAWGRHGAHQGRDEDVVHRLRACASGKLYCLGKNKDGSPRHPLMLAYDTPLEEWL